MAIAVSSRKGVPFSYSRSKVIQYHSKDHLQRYIRNELKLYIFNCQGLPMCGFSEEAHEKGKEVFDPERGAD